MVIFDTNSRVILWGDVVADFLSSQTVVVLTGAYHGWFHGAQELPLLLMPNE